MNGRRGCKCRRGFNCSKTRAPGAMTPPLLTPRGLRHKASSWILLFMCRPKTCFLFVTKVATNVVRQCAEDSHLMEEAGRSLCLSRPPTVRGGTPRRMEVRTQGPLTTWDIPRWRTTETSHTTRCAAAHCAKAHLVTKTVIPSQLASGTGGCTPTGPASLRPFILPEERTN